MPLKRRTGMSTRKVAAAHLPSTLSPCGCVTPSSFGCVAQRCSSIRLGPQRDAPQTAAPHDGIFRLNAADPTDAISLLIRAWRGGDTAARDQLVAQLMPGVRAVSERELRRLAQPVSLQPSDLVQESVMELLKRGAASADAAHLRALAAGIVRTTLIDYLRVRNAGRRGRRETSNLSITLLHNLGSDAPGPVDLVAVHDALEAMQQVSPRAARIVELRVFGGLTESEIAVALDVSRPTVSRDWATAKLWLARQLSEVDSAHSAAKQAHER